MKLGNLKKIYEMLEFDGEHSGSQKPNFDVFDKKLQKLAVKHSIEKPIFFNFVNFSTTFCPRSSEETDSHF